MAATARYTTSAGDGGQNDAGQMAEPLIHQVALLEGAGATAVPVTKDTAASQVSSVTRRSSRCRFSSRTDGDSLGLQDVVTLSTRRKTNQHFLRHEEGAVHLVDS